MQTHLIERRRARGSLAHRVLTMLLAAAVLVLAPVAAHAHDTLTDSSPRDGEVVTAPDELTLTFSGEISPLGTAVTVEGPDGDAVAGDPEVDGRVVTVPLAADLAAGGYTVAWRVTSGDGHPISGEFGFEVEADETEEPESPATSEPEAETTAPAGTTSEDTATEAETAADDEVSTPEEPTATEQATQEPTAPTAPAEDTGDSGISPWVWVVAGLVVAGLAGAIVAVSRRGP